MSLFEFETQLQVRNADIYLHIGRSWTLFVAFAVLVRLVATLWLESRSRVWRKFGASLLQQLTWALFIAIKAISNCGGQKSKVLPASENV